MSMEDKKKCTDQTYPELLAGWQQQLPQVHYQGSRQQNLYKQIDK